MTETLHLVLAPNDRTIRLTRDNEGLRVSIDSPGQAAVSASVTLDDIAELYDAASAAAVEPPPATPPGGATDC